MGAYTYLPADTITGTFVGDELPLSNVSYDIRVNDAAQMTADLPVDGITGPVDFLEPGRTSIYVDHGGSIPFSGILWDWPIYDSETRSLQLSFLDFFSYWDHLLISESLSYAATDQLAVARSLFGYGMNKGGSNLAPAYTGTALSGVLRDRDYLGTDLAPIGQRIRELSAVDQGFDFRVYSRWENGYPRRVVQLGYPILGRAYPASGLVFDLDVDCTKWTAGKAGSVVASTIYATGSVAPGSPSGTLPDTYLADDPSVRAAGYPRLESAQTFDEITGATSLQQRASGALTVSRVPQQTMQFILNGDSGPDVGSYLPGDQCLGKVARGDGLFRYGAEITATITGVSVRVDDEHNDTTTLDVAPISVTQGVAR